MGYFLSSSIDGKVICWDLAKGGKYCEFSFEKEVHCVLFDINESYFYVGC